MSQPHPRVAFQAVPSPSAQDAAFDHELGNLGAGQDALYDPYAPHVPLLLPNRGSRQPQTISVSQPTYRPFDPQHLYTGPTSNGRKRDPFMSPSETDFLKTPLSALFPDGIPKPPRRQLFRSFEAPEWAYILIHLTFCVLAYPVLLVFVVIANHRTIFWSRLVVGLGCGVVGLALAASLTRLAQRYMEAATWATLIHQSQAPGGPGMRMKDFADNAQYPTSPFNALRLLYRRLFIRNAARSARTVHHDSRPWSLVIVAFLILVVLAGSLSFVFGRVVAIDVAIEHQRNRYFELAIAADSSESDIERATQLDPAFNDFTLTWTLSPFSSHGGLPPAVSFQYQNDTVYFAETAKAQLIPNGSGFGTFDSNTTAASIQTSDTSLSDNLGETVNAGVLLRYPRWGIRIRCKNIPRAESGLTYLFTPRDLLRDLFSSFNQDLPPSLEQSLNVSSVMRPNDTFPSALNPDDIASAAIFFDNGVSVSFKSTPVSMGDDGKGFVSIESLLVRLNTTYAPNGTFLTHNEVGVPDVTGQTTFIAQDAAVCLELYEPWVVETYNNSIGVPTSLQIVNKGNTIVDSVTQSKEVNIAPPLTDPKIKRHLDSTNLSLVYDVAHGNSANQILKDNGRDAFYVPSPTLVSYTGGEGPRGYRELSAYFFEQSRGMADASNVLTYFAGSGQAVARVYPDSVLAESRINNFEAAIVIAAIFVLGLVAGLFVPRLPMAVPRRGFELYSWMAAFYGRELELDQVDETDGLKKRVELSDIENRLGELRFRY
ncbi:hypothetical protein R3P38DRAFT_3489065, partial [Favolaschia claudopus]